MTISKMHQIADELEASNIGYDQYERFSFLDKPNKAIIPNKEGDCSSTCGAIAWLGGYPVNLSDPFYTGNYKERLTQAGFKAISVKNKSRDSLLSMLEPGDHLLGPGHVIYVRSNSSWWSAENDERGKSFGGKAGDQTGLEARFRAPYMRSRGWEWILRPPADETKPNNIVTKPPVEESKGVEPRILPLTNQPTDLVMVIQEIVGSKVDGILGPRSKEAIWYFQKRMSLSRDGVFGPKSVNAYLESVGNLYLGKPEMPSTAVKLVQWIVRSRVDGDFGPLTESDIKNAQVWAGLDPDGNFGPSCRTRIVR